MWVFFLSSTAIFNEQQARNRNVAFTTLHRLLLRNVHSTNSGVSSLSDTVSSSLTDSNTLLSPASPFSPSEQMSEYFALCVCFRPYAAANFYQRALLANALTSALRLHQRLPRFQLSRAFLAQALQEDSCHYLLYSLILVNSYPITSILSTSNLGKREMDSSVYLWETLVYVDCLSARI